jgi:hypothetical protein
MFPIRIVRFPQIIYKVGIRSSDLFYLSITTRVSSFKCCFLCALFCQMSFLFLSFHKYICSVYHHIRFFFSFPIFARHFSSFLPLAQGLFLPLTLEYIRVWRLVHLPIYSWLFCIGKRCKCVCLASILIFGSQLAVPNESTSQHFQNFSSFSLLQICWLRINKFVSSMALAPVQKQKRYRENLGKKVHLVW